MFLLSRPSELQIRTILAGQRSLHFSYSGVGATRGAIPSGHTVTHGRIDLGQGSSTFDRAAEALRQWKMFDLPHIRLCWPDAPIQVGEAVAVVIKHFGFWSLNCCKIVYVTNEDAAVRRFGFAYGTLPEHAEQGEERFTVEWDRTSDLVSYEIQSFSRPGKIVVKAGYPLARILQKRFLQHSLAAMVSAVCM
jgi:uncharacterized protein (UPF0548 family)